MSEITIIHEEGNAPQNFSKGYLTFPFESEHFKDFITGLLGKPQTISKSISGTFELHLKDLQSFHDLVMQRVVQQNKGSLIQFTAKIFYNDRSSVQLGSYAELVSYNEVKPVVSEAVQLNWDFLIQFHDKNQPEKQTIELLIITTNNIAYDDEIISLPFIFNTHGQFRIHIAHTARSWGSDIENMLSHQIESHLIRINRIKKFIRTYSTNISVGLGLMFFLSTVIGSYIVSQHFINSELHRVHRFMGSKTHTVDQQVDYLISYIASGVTTQHYFKVSIFLLSSIIVSIVLGVWIENSASKNIEPSFLVLTRKALEYRDETKKKLQANWRIFISSILLAILTGVASNFVFKYLVE